MGKRFKTELISSRFGRRLFLLFFGCALVPIGLLAAVTYFNVTNQLTQQAYRALQVSAKNSGMFVFMNLMDLEAGLDHVISEHGAPGQQPVLTSSGMSRLVRLGWDEKPPVSENQATHWPVLSEAQREDLRRNMTVVITGGQTQGLTRIYMVRMAPDGRSILMGELDQAGIGKKSGMDFKPASSEFHVLTRTGEFLYSTQPQDLPDIDSLGQDGQSQAQFRWWAGDEEHLVSQWELFLGSHFSSESWVISTSRPVSDVLSPVQGFNTWFILVSLLSISGISLISLMQIRRTMKPLAVLGNGTRNVSAGKFDMALEVHSNDELEDLAGSFNEMSRQLGRQFEIMTSVGEIGRAALSSLEKEKIVEILTTRMGNVLACGTVTLCLMSESESHAFLVTAKKDSLGVDDLGRFLLSAEHIKGFNDHPDHLIHKTGSDWSRFISLATDRLESPELVLPMFLKSQLAGVMSLSYPQLSVLGDGPFQERLKTIEIPLARQMADQFVVALANAKLVENLNTMNWGILHTLARAVDAKTHWTSGHSERVCSIAIDLGREMGLEAADLEVLQRGALLHDLGKLGIPDNVLDKPGKLTAEEFDQIRQHPSIGARILEPVKTEESISAMVHQHHEHWDGQGYPDGLQGNEISPFAQIVAVADVFDALAYDRPYREGWAREKVVSFIIERRGLQFAPEVVDAFIKAVENPEFGNQSVAETNSLDYDLEAVK